MSLDFSSITGQIDFSAVASGILAVSAALVSVACLMIGAALIIRAIRGGKIKREGKNGFAFTLTDKILNLDDGSIVIFGDDGSANHYRSSSGGFGGRQKAGNSGGFYKVRSSGRVKGGRGGRGFKRF